MSDNNSLNIVAIIDKLTDWKICLTICIASAIMILIINKQILLFNNELYNFSVIFIFLLSLVMLIIKICIILDIYISDQRYYKKSKIQRLNEIFMEVKPNNNGYKYFAERVIIRGLYKNKLKEFSVNDLNTIIQGNPLQIQDIVNNLCNNKPYSKNAILTVERGLYKFHSCVWNELKSYEKNGLLGDN